MSRLTIDDCIKLYEDGWEIKENFGIVNHNLLGLCEPSLYEIYLYAFNIPNKKEYDITAIHELIHAKYEYMSENKVENLGIKMYSKFPELSEFIRDLWKLEGYE